MCIYPDLEVMGETGRIGGVSRLDSNLKSQKIIYLKAITNNSQVLAPQPNDLNGEPLNLY